MAFLDLFKEENRKWTSPFVRYSVFDCHSIDKTAPEGHEKKANETKGSKALLSSSLDKVGMQLCKCVLSSK